MDRIQRTGLGLGAALLLGFAGTALAADYLLDAQARIAQSESGTETSDYGRFDAFHPAIAVAEGEYTALLVWSGDDAGIEIGEDEQGNDRRLVDNEFEIVGKLVSTLALQSNGPNFRISTMGNDEETEAAQRERFAGREPAVVWNPVAEEFLVVWSGDDDSGPLVDDEFEIFAQRVSLETELLGDRIRISHMGNDAETGASERTRFTAATPAVAVDPESGSYLVTWQGDHDAAPLVDEEFEIFGRVLNADAEPAGEQFRISFMGADTTADSNTRAAFQAYEPAAAFNPVSGNFVVAWHADNDADGMVNGENEIFLQQVSPTGQLDGAVVRVSNMGPDGNAAFDGTRPALAVRPETGALLVAWEGDTSTSTLVEGEKEIHCRLLDSTLTPLGEAFRVSRMGPDDEADVSARGEFEAVQPAVAWGEKPGQFIVSWRGDTENGTLVNDEYEIFARLVSANGGFASSQFRVSYQGDDDEADTGKRQDYEALTPAATYSASSFIVVWGGDTNLSGGTNNRYQVFGRRVAEDYAELALALKSKSENVIAPEPFEVVLELSNSGESAASNVVVRLEMSTPFSYEWSGCESVTSQGHCAVGDLAPGDEKEFGVTLSTEDVEFNGEQSTQLDFITVSDTALQAASGSSYSTFAGVTVKVDGGRGALGMPLLALLGLLPLFAARRRR